MPGGFTKIFSTLVLWSVLLTCARAQVEIVQSNNYGIREGLPEREIRDVQQTSDGLLWFTSAAGLTRFDGYRFVNLNENNLLPDNQSVLKAKGLTMIDRHDNLYIQPIFEFDFFEVFNTKKFSGRSFPLREASPFAGEYADIFAEKNVSAHLLSYTDSEFHIYRFDADDTPALYFSYATELRCDKGNHQITAAADGTIYLLDGCAGKIIAFKNKNIITEIKLPAEFGNTKYAEEPVIFYADSKGRIWLSDFDSQNLYVTDKNLRQIRKTDFLPESQYVNRLWEDRRGNLIFAQSSRNYTAQLFLYDTQEKVTDLSQILEKEKRRISLQSRNFARKINLVSSGGYYEFFFADAKKNTRVDNYLTRNVEPGQFGAVMRGFAEDEAGNIYASTESDAGSFYKIDAVTKELIKIPRLDNDGRVHKYVSCATNWLLRDKKLYGVSCEENYDGNLEVYDLQTETWRQYALPEAQVYPRYILPKGEDEFWLFCNNFKTKMHAVYVFNRTAETFSEIPVTLPETQQKGNAYSYAAHGKDGEIWLGTFRNLIKFTPADTTFRAVEPTDGKTFLVAGIYPADDVLLIAAYDKGVIVYDINADKFSKWHYNTESENDAKIPVFLSDKNAASILKVDENRWFVGTDNGLNLVDLAEQTTLIFNRRQGFGNYEFNRMSAFRASDGKFYFGGINGFDAFYLEDVLRPDTISRPVVTRFYYLAKNATEEKTVYHAVRENAPLRLPSSHLYFGFDFTLPEFDNTENNRYKLYLEGIDKDFGAFTNVPTVRYNKLPAGEYTLHLKSYDARGNESPVLSVPIVAEAPLYLRPWFVLTILAVGLLGVYLVSNYLLRKRVAQQLSEKRAQERIAKKFTELELEALRAQLNPHFVFNALGAIQHFIGQHDPQRAKAYLADFAKLMRMFLESSKKQFVSLSEELDLIKFYVRLEEMRFGEKFRTEYEIDENLDLFATEIPTSLMQPFVENAVNHGLFNRGTGGILKIAVREIEETLIEIRIIDNGIGRAKSKELSKRSLKKHKSRATEILRERIQMLNSLGDFEIEVTEQDAFPGAEYCGTEIMVLLRERE